MENEKFHFQHEYTYVTVPPLDEEQFYHSNSSTVIVIELTINNFAAYFRDSLIIFLYSFDHNLFV